MAIDDTNKTQPEKTADFMHRLRDSLAKDPPPTPPPSTESVEKYAPPAVRAAAKTSKAPNHLQTIGQFVTALTYREAMAMGRGIVAKLKNHELNEVILTAALQDWAWEWETFEEENRPGATSS